MTGEVKAGVVVLAAVVVATIAWLALRPEPRHDGLTRADAERTAAFGDRPGRCGVRVRCRAVEGHWRCVMLLPGGGRFVTRPGDEAVAGGLAC